jgi:hypothetical protein
MIRNTPDDLQTFYNYQYVIYDTNGKRIKVLCRKCGETIADVIDVEKGHDSITGVVITGQAFRNLPNYTTVQLSLSNGGEMFSAMCKKCAKHLSREEIDAVYLSEIQAIEYDAAVHDKTLQTIPLINALLDISVLRRIN